MITIKYEDAATLMAALLLALQAKPKGMTAKNIEDTQRLVRDIARQAEEHVQ